MGMGGETHTTGLQSRTSGERTGHVAVSLALAAAAAGIALINSIGNLGGFAGPYLVGVMKDATGSTDGGLVALAAILAVGSLVATRVAHDPAVERDPREPTGRFTRKEAPALERQPVR
jgi:nitrate/nitrite transporter NarK